MSMRSDRLIQCHLIVAYENEGIGSTRVFWAEYVIAIAVRLMTSKSRSFTKSVRFLMVDLGIETAACLRDIHSSFLGEYPFISINMALNYRPRESPKALNWVHGYF